MSLLGTYEGPAQVHLDELVHFLEGRYVYRKVVKVWDKLVVRENMWGGYPVEAQYYCKKKLNQRKGGRGATKDICAVCVSGADLVLQKNIGNYIKERRR